MLIVSDSSDAYDDIEKIAINCPSTNPYVTPPTTPERLRRISRTSPPALFAPTAIGVTLQQASASITISDSLPKKLGNAVCDTGMKHMESKFRQFHHGRTLIDNKVPPLKDDEYRIYVRRALYVADLIVLAPPSDTTRFAEERTRIFGLIFGREEKYSPLRQVLIL
jgi:hypothetical protein